MALTRWPERESGLGGGEMKSITFDGFLEVLNALEKDLENEKMEAYGLKWNTQTRRRQVLRRLKRKLK